jgi:hypothetical protein
VGGGVEVSEGRGCGLGGAHDGIRFDDLIEPSRGDGIDRCECLGQSDGSIERRRGESVTQDGDRRVWHRDANGDLIGLEFELAGAPTR